MWILFFFCKIKIVRNQFIKFTKILDEIYKKQDMEFSYPAHVF